MLTILKNKTQLEIKNIVCFYVGLNVKIDSPEELKHKKEEDWTYQDYLTACCDENEYNLIWLNKASVKYSYKDNVINIDDDVTNVHVSLNKKNVHDTIIFQGQANDDMDINYEGLMRAFEYMGFFMLNTVDEIKIASDKFLSSNLLSSKGIPQPNYILVTQNLLEDLTSDTKDTKQSFWDALDSIYDNNMPIDLAMDKNDIKYVCKILDGSLGIGVFICKRSEIESILQTMFQIKPDAKFIIQQFKDNTGDIRVHLLSIDGINYEVVACMKRNKIDNDFRSNVSLGATTEQYELDDKQKEIVINTAKISGCRWVGVDLMACKDGSNVVIEYNSSPGVQGISQQIGQNMFTIVINKIKDYLQKHATYDGTPRDEDNLRTCYSIYDPNVITQLEDLWNALSEPRKKILHKCLEIQPGMYYQPNGKESPEKGLDCSGYVKWIYENSIDEKLPDMCAKYFLQFDYPNLEQISLELLQPGDIGLVSDSTILNHCGIYAGDLKWFECNCFYGALLTDCGKFNYFFRIKDIDLELNPQNILMEEV